ncbi:MAG: DnaJ domain-containing protein [Deltaproteobacteria bacterium]|nr:DnaJ domain-containing protein [Deltaproteobacteria bacterium]
MSFYLKTILIIFGLAYLISPVDIIPDLLLPFVGWIDDGVVIASIYYLIRFGKLPNFFFKKQNPFKQPSGQNHASFTSKKGTNKKRDYQQTNKNRSSKSIPTPHEVLGITPDASKKEIQNAYRQAIKKYHPDKLSHLGKDFSNLANEKFLEIQKAYDTLMAEYTN